MQKIVFVKGNNLTSVNEMLSSGWNVKDIVTCEQHVAVTGGSHSSQQGECFAYIVLERN